jgi:hypothetical protein
MAKEYHITHEQLRDLGHYEWMFDSTSEQVKELCNQERSDIEYGFELGRLHSTLRTQYLNMMSLLNTIRKQTIEDENKLV